MVSQQIIESNFLPSFGVNLPEIDVRLECLNSSHEAFYLSIYSNADLMKYIRTQLSIEQIKSNFSKCLKHLSKQPPTYITYVINNSGAPLGLVSLKSAANNEVEFGIIIDVAYQGAGWSRCIKRHLYDYLFNHFAINSIVSYCDERNVVANHINQTMGFELAVHEQMERFNRVIKKWVCHVSSFINN